MNAPLDYTIPSDEIPQVRLRALEDAWADDKKLADACDSEQVLRWLRKTRTGLIGHATKAYIAEMLEQEISIAFQADPSFSDWCDEAREKMSKEIPD